ncbi:unnamed protein product [Adineta steineri]|uniref:Uncharacterized protein n=1 Tax=Adineta steineri TaxID=433720 RepID=A0A814QAF5_9BILA|nr:unnamed protein product [Adineta steineri]CAF4264774.1 unnamed protein product [Adineta steineri]
MDITNKLVHSNTISSINPPKRVRIESDDWIDKASRSRFLERWKEQEIYIDYLESRLNQFEQSIDSNERVREKEAECKKLKSMLNYGFLTKTTQQQSFEQIRHLMQIPSLSRLRQTYLDPSINFIFDQMRAEIDQCRKARNEAQNELQAFQFTSDSKIGKMLMARCKKLLDENEQLGKLISSENVAKLEGEVALQKRLLSNMKNSQKDYEEIMLNMDTNMDAMSNTLLHMRSQLIDSHRQIQNLSEENIRLKNLYESNGTNHIAEKSNRTTPKIDIRNKLDDLNGTISLPIVSSVNDIMDIDSISLNSTTNDINQHSTKNIPHENGININHSNEILRECI